MGFFDKLFGGGDDASPAPRSLDHPQDLTIGDIVKFGFSAQSSISNQSFKVAAINTFDLGGDSKQKTVFTLEGADDRIELTINKERGREQLELSLAIYPETVEQLFDIEKFGMLFDEDSGVNHRLDRIGEPEAVSGWTASVYRQEASHQAYFLAGDYRGKSVSRASEAGEAFDYYRLTSDDRQFAIEAQVYDGGRTDVYLIAMLPLDKLEEMWPA